MFDMMKPLCCFLSALVLPGVLLAEDDIPLLRPDERRAVDEQTTEFNKALSPALQTSAQSTVRVWVGMRRAAYGTVVGDGKKIITKWSEIATKRGEMRVEGAKGELRSVTVSGVYQDEDLAVLTVDGDALTPIRWNMQAPALGSFIVAPMPDARLAAFGVVSVLERNLRETDQSYLGVVGDIRFDGPGVRIEELDKKSGAAAAGLKAGDILLRVGERTISGLSELKNALNGTKPGQLVKMLVRSGSEERMVEVTLGNRPVFGQAINPRLQQMEHMGGEISQVRGSFTRAIQTDMRIIPNQVGGPVADLQGRAIGITLARADRTRSFIMPASALVELLAKEPENPSLAKTDFTSEDDQPQVVMQEGPGQQPPSFPRGNSPKEMEMKMRRHLSDMQRLMDRMNEEMGSVEGH